MPVVEIGTAHVDMTGMSYATYARRYCEAAVMWEPLSRAKDEFDPVLYYLYCLSLELHLKSFIWLCDGIGRSKMKNRYGHDLAKLWRHSKDRGLRRHIAITKLRDHAVSVVSPYYKDRRFNYLDIGMIYSGYSDLKAEPQLISGLRRLTERLCLALEQPIIRAS